MQDWITLALGGEAKARKDWITSCEFHPLTNAEVLDRVHRGAEFYRDHSPVVLLDLDSTLYEVGTRTLRILKEWVDSPESAAYPSVRARIAAITHDQMGYSLDDTFHNLELLAQVSPEAAGALRSAKAFWFARFFRNDYLKYDEVYPGAAEFARQLHADGAKLIYLTGRDEPGMGKGTRDRLIADGFPFNVDGTELLLKRTFEEDDLEHKSNAADVVRKRGRLIASFENEPPNLIALSDLFPQSMHVFVDTIYSDRAAIPKRGLFRITGFTDPS